TSDCEEVLRSRFGKPFGVPLPLIGLAGFGGLFVLSLLRARRPVAALALLAGAVGLALLAVQLFVLRQVCPLCVLVDSLALLGAVLAVRPGAPQPGVTPAGWGLWLAGGLGVLGVGVALGYAGQGETDRPAAPPEVRALWVSGKINVVEATDFTCP